MHTPRLGLLGRRLLLTAMLVWIGESSSAVSLAIADEPATKSSVVAERPTWTVGSSWQYKGRAVGPISRIDQIESKETIDGKEYYVLKVTGVPSGRHLWTDYTDENFNFAFEKDGQGNVVDSVTPALEAFNWPLVVGKSWTQQITETKNGQTFRFTQESRVVAYEKVKTPAGEFDAFKITRKNVGGVSWFDFWYAPAVQGVVKVDARTTYGTLYTELVKYELK